MIDKKSADDAGYKLGDTVPVVTKAGRNDYTLTGIVKFGTAEQPARRDHRRVHARRPRRSVLGDARAVRLDRREGRLRCLAGRGRAPTSAPRCEGEPRHRERRGDQRQGRSPRRARTTSRTTCRSSTRSCSIFGVVALLVGSFIIFNTFSIIVAQRGRELALLRAIGAGQRQVLGSVLFEAVLVGLVASIVGFVGGHLPRRRAQGAARRARARHPGQRDRHPGERGDLVVRHRHARHRRRRDVPGVARVADPADRRDARRRRSTARARRAPRRRSASLVTLARVALAAASGCSATAALHLRRARHGRRVPRASRSSGPIIATPISGVLGIADPQFKGITGSIARENAMRNPKRTSATAAALDDRRRARRPHHRSSRRRPARRSTPRSTGR